MLYSLALLFLSALIFGGICSKLKLPPLIGMLISGILLGPSVLDLLDGSLLDISAQLRKIALIIILTRAGLGLDINALKKVGRPALLMCFLPATAEIAGTLLLAPRLIGITLSEAAVLGTVLAAVSPAVVVPGMLKLISGGYGTKKGIPQLVMAGASVDDVYVIVLFTSFTAIASGDGFSPAQLIRIPFSVFSGLIAGALTGIAAEFILRKLKASTDKIIVAAMSISFLFIYAEDKFTGFFGFSGLLAIMSMNAVYRKRSPRSAEDLSSKYKSLWTAAEMILFVLVGAAADIGCVMDSGLKAAVLVLAVMIFRMGGVFLCVLGTKLNAKERLFCMAAYTPKATVQAAIGSVPLAMGLSCGNIVLTAAVLAILITAPLGAFLIDFLHTRLLERETASNQ